MCVINCKIWFAKLTMNCTRCKSLIWVPGILLKIIYCWQKKSLLELLREIFEISDSLCHIFMPYFHPVTGVKIIV